MCDAVKRVNGPLQCYGVVLVLVVVDGTDLSGKEPYRQVGVGRVVTSGSIGGVMVSVVVCTDLSGKELHRQVGVGMVVTSESLGGVMVTVVVCTDLSGNGG